MKNQRGITLVTLIITIVLLLILAGVAVFSLTEDDGVLDIAREKSQDLELKLLKDSVKSSYTEYKTWSDNGLGKELEVYLNTIEDATVEKVADDTYYVKRGNSQVIVYDDGDIYEGEIWDGGTECPVFKEFNWYIYTPSQLKFLADFVNNGNSLAEGQAELLTNAGYRPEDVKMEETTIVYLMNNLDLGARPTDGNWNTTENESKKWIPIGNKKANNFIGIFEGNHKTVKGVYVNQTTNYTGIFGYASNTIQNVIVKDNYIEGGNCVGGLVGSVNYLLNCHNVNAIVVQKEGNYRYAGGLAGQVSGKEKNESAVSNCTNSGKVIANGIDYSIDTGITGCGGIAGFLSQNNIMVNCINKGTVIGKGDWVGGVVGNSNLNVYIIECTNNALITGYEETVAGIIGNVGPSNTISKCSNTGIINGRLRYIGGIAGDLVSQNEIANSKIEKCYNSGKIIGGADFIGGIVGLIRGENGQGTIEKCYNRGIITGTEKIGEIVGYQNNRTGLNTLNKLFYLKKSNNLTAIGLEADNVEKQIMSVSDDLTPEQFFTWIESK